MRPETQHCLSSLKGLPQTTRCRLSSDQLLDIIYLVILWGLSPFFFTCTSPQITEVTLERKRRALWYIMAWLPLITEYRFWLVVFKVPAVPTEDSFVWEQLFPPLAENLGFPMAVGYRDRWL